MNNDGERRGAIYAFVNKENNKKYIGRTLDIDHRIKTHLIRINKGLNNHTFYEDYRTNPDNFYILILLNNVPESKLNDLEKYFIKKYDSFNNGYNMTNGGDTATKIRYSKERNQKISQTLKNNSPSKGKHRVYNDPNNPKMGWKMM